MINSQFSGKWSEKPLSDLAVITMGQSPSSIFYNAHGEGLPLIQGNADIEARKTIERVWTTKGNKHCDLGDLILTVRAPVGAVAVASKNACIGRGVCGLKPFGNSSFLFHALVYAEDRWQALEQGSTFTAANSEQVGQFPLFVPEDENEQRAIAETLSDMDGLLNALDALIAKKRAIKQAAMQQLLTGKTRLSGFSGAWETKRLGEITKIQKGSLITEKSVVPGPIPVIAGGQKPPYYHNTANRTGKTITVSGSGAYAGFVAFHSQPIFASDCSTISENSSFSIDFIYYFLVFNQEVIYKAQTGGAQPHIHPVDLMPLEVNLPELSEQKAIASVLSDMDTEISALEQRRDKTRAIKQGMMQQLLTGRVRLVKSGTVSKKSRKLKVK